jgi:predicted DNA-binding transcriptional regulator YafY
MAKTGNFLEFIKILLERKGEIICPEEFGNRFGHERTVKRYFIELSEYQNIVKIGIEKKAGEKGRQKECYKLVSASDILLEFFKKSDDIEHFIHWSNSLDPEIFQDLEENSQKALHNILNSNDEVFYFKNAEFEEIKNREIFKKIKIAIQNRNLINFQHYYRGQDIEVFEAKPIRILFNENNWYLLFVENENLQFSRINFINSLEIVEKRFLKSEIEKFEKLIPKIQNPMTLFNQKPKVAKIRALSGISKYFGENSKKFLRSQKFLKENRDGSVDFEISYTQPLEVLPFIKKWLPNLQILESPEAELQKALQKDLKEMLAILEK